MYISTSDAQRLSSAKAFLYSRLEASSPFFNNKLGGGLGMVQALRYTETPVVPYDEIVVLPGNLKHEIEIEGERWEEEGGEEEEPEGYENVC